MTTTSNSTGKPVSNPGAPRLRPAMRAVPRAALLFEPRVAERGGPAIPALGMPAPLRGRAGGKETQAAPCLGLAPRAPVSVARARRGQGRYEDAHQHDRDRRSFPRGHADGK